MLRSARNLAKYMIRGVFQSSCLTKTSLTKLSLTQLGLTQLSLANLILTKLNLTKLILLIHSMGFSGSVMRAIKGLIGQ